MIELLAPITNAAQVPSHPSISRSFTSKTIRNMARRAMEIINEEHKHTIQFAKLMSVFLGDDPYYLDVSKLNLPIFNHLDGVTDKNGNAQLNHINGDHVNGSSAAKQGELAERLTSNSSITPTAPSSSSSSSSASNTTAVADSSSGRSKTNKKKPATTEEEEEEDDPFFGLPQIIIDRDYGIKTEEADDARQLTQIAQQRSEEFIRCMVKVRKGLLKAERYQDKVFRWCKEMAGEDDDSDGMENHNITK